MSGFRSSRWALLVLAASFVVAACGQKPGVHIAGASGNLGGEALDSSTTGGDTTGDSTGTTTSGGGDSSTSTSSTGGGSSTSGTGTSSTSGGSATSGSSATSGTTSGSSTTSGSTATSGSSTSGTSTGSTSTTSGSTSGGRLTPTGTDRTGVTETSIKIAVHAPQTGAAPLPSTSFEDARDLYWLWQINDKQRKILGRSEVVVEFADDHYKPDDARQYCRQLAATSFFIAGGGGTDQIQACGALAKIQKYPYFSAGVTEAGLENNPWYFAASMTYRQQGVLLAHYIKKHFPGQKFAMIATQTANFDDAIAGFEQGIDQAGIRGDFYKVLRHTKGDQTWYNGIASDLSQNQVEVVYILSSPVDYINFAKQAKQNNYTAPGRTAAGVSAFQFVGVGVTMGLNAILPTGCKDPANAVDGGIFFSPFPGLDVARQIEPDFFTAAQKYGKVADDLALALWGLAKQTDMIFTDYERTFGTDLTREDFRALVESTTSLKSNLFPEVGYSPSNHFGGKEVHVLQADCAAQEYKTLESFVNGF